MALRWTTQMGAHGLLPEEEDLVRGAVAKRRNEVASVRRCARNAFADLGIPHAHRTPVRHEPGGRRPRWPPGMVGSLTHCAGFAAAAVARKGTVRAVGVDAEPAVPLPKEAHPRVLLPSEQAWTEKRAAAHAWSTAVFCAKEALYKAWNPVTDAWLDFDEAEVEPVDSTVFRVHLAREFCGTRALTGRWRRTAGVWFAALTVTADIAVEDRTTQGPELGERRYT